MGFRVYRVKAFRVSIGFRDPGYRFEGLGCNRTFCKTLKSPFREISILSPYLHPAHVLCHVTLNPKPCTLLTVFM